jgi:anti-sigma factor RsiW
MMELLRHWRWSRRVADLLDHDLDPDDRARIRAHVDRCGACARRLGRLERSEALLARMPRLLFPLEVPAGAEANARLETLAQWGDAPIPRSPYGPIPAASALAMAGLVFVLSVTAQEWAPVVGDMGASTTVASVLPDASLYPLTFR